MRRKVVAGVHYRGIHLHPYYASTYGLKPEDFPVATAIWHRTLSVALSPKVSERDQDDVVSALAEALPEAAS